MAGVGLEREWAGDNEVVDEGVDDVEEGTSDSSLTDEAEVRTIEGEHCCSPAAKKSADKSADFHPLSKLRGNSRSGEMGDMAR